MSYVFYEMSPSNYNEKYAASQVPAPVGTYSALER